MTTRRKLIYAVLALLLAFFAHQVWTSRASFLVWKITYLGVHIARWIHQPNYDSLASARVFDGLVIVINGLIYFCVLVALDRSLVWLRTRRAARPAATTIDNGR